MKWPSILNIRLHREQHEDTAVAVKEVVASAARVVEATQQFTKHTDILSDMVKRMKGPKPKKRSTRK